MTDQSEMTAAEKIAAWMETHGVSVESTFIPYSKSRNAKAGPGRDKPWPSLNWKIRIMRAGRLVLETDYSAGIGHAPAMKAKASSLQLGARERHRNEQKAREELAALEIEKGRPHRFSHGWGTRVVEGSKVVEPEAADVLASLVLDSSVLDAGGFEAWAEELGYDTDSRSAEATYRACLEIAVKLRAGLGDQALTDLRDACQDY